MAEVDYDVAQEMSMCRSPKGLPTSLHDIGLPDKADDDDDDVDSDGMDVDKPTARATTAAAAANKASDSDDDSG
jgi:hypothetical protein